MLCRCLTVFALMFWQGGFVFYAAVVVPVAMSILEPPALQSFVTLAVTRYLNLAGASTLAILALEVWLTPDVSTRRRISRWLCWLLMTAALVALFLVHPQLVRFMDQESKVILDRQALWPLHRLYLLVSAAQWLCAVIFVVLTLRAWKEEDRRQ
jgi:hypothetical protein